MMMIPGCTLKEKTLRNLECRKKRREWAVRLNRRVWGLVALRALARRKDHGERIVS